MKTHRLARVSETVREVAANTILFELKDPRVKNVTVTRAEVTADLQHAKVFVSVMGSEKDQQLTMYGLEHAAGFVQSKLAKRLATRFVPHVTFVLDLGIKKSLEIARLLQEEKERSGVAAGGSADTDDTDGDAPAADAPAAPTPPPRADAADGPADHPAGPPQDRRE